MKDEQLSMDELRLPFGTYVQVKEPSTQTNTLRWVPVGTRREVKYSWRWIQVS